MKKAIWMGLAAATGLFASEARATNGDAKCTAARKEIVVPNFTAHMPDVWRETLETEGGHLAELQRMKNAMVAKNYAARLAEYRKAALQLIRFYSHQLKVFELCSPPGVAPQTRDGVAVEGPSGAGGGSVRVDPGRR